MKKIFMILFIFIMLPFFTTGCSKKEYTEIGNWETQNVKDIYSLQELKEMSKTERDALSDTYIKVKAKFKSSYCENDIYYMVYVTTIEEEEFYVSAISYENYWEINYAYGEEKYIEGYVYSTSIDYIKIKPAHITKA